jgi:hypothetical protein
MTFTILPSLAYIDSVQMHGEPQQPEKTTQ